MPPKATRGVLPISVRADARAASTPTSEIGIPSHLWRAERNTSTTSTRRIVPATMNSGRSAW